MSRKSNFEKKNKATKIRRQETRSQDSIIEHLIKLACKPYSRNRFSKEGSDFESYILDLRGKRSKAPDTISLNGFSNENRLLVFSDILNDNLITGIYDPAIPDSFVCVLNKDEFFKNLDNLSPLEYISYTTDQWNQYLALKDSKESFNTNVEN